MIPSLMDDTSHILLTLTKEHFTLSIPSAINNADLIQELPISDETSRERSWSESDPSLGAWMEHVTDSLQEHAKSFLPIKTGLNSGDLNSLSSVVTCFHGFLWGITSILRDKYEKDSEEHDLLLSWLSSWSKDTTDSKLKMFITFTEDFINSCLSALLVVNSQQPTCSEKDFAEGSRSRKKLSSSRKKLSRSGKNAGFTIDILIERQLLNKPLLQKSLEVDNPELAFCVRQLLIGSSAILSLKIQISRRACFSSSMPILIRTSQYLLTEFANIVQGPHSVSYICLAGAIKYLEVLGSYVSSRAKDSFKNVYAMLIDIHLQAMGRCISLCGKEATLASHEIESSTKTLVGQMGPPKSSAGHRWNFLREFRARLRLSFNALVRKDSKLRRTTAITAIERALGVREQCSMVYEIYAEGPDGGKVSDTVAAGVDCFDSVVQSVSGPSSLKKHIKGLTGALFNIVLHLQGPQIFYEKVSCNGEDVSPDPGAVILMCVEVLIKVFGKPEHFQLDSDHVVQSLCLPGALFRGFCYRKHSRTSPDPAVVSPDQMFSPACVRLCNMDTRFSVDLFAACCRLLSTVIRLHSRATKMAVAILQDSVSVLLHCLETRDVELVYENGYSTWEVEEGRLCASFLCRVYEQIKLKKEDFERDTLSFLSEYMCLFRIGS
ncbi:uncharacterized protein LOC113290644 isoform X2 [Papaver somniferum]|uniref:uncharacterized protein LOC113290644 isoform X2 n=1 Tax=Papaver somniferum TaxID=3469 RepID=UPI000E700095|nr:uncharacterized protein LOC113290644 isoform X2 [Papaver somniferum]